MSNEEFRRTMLIPSPKKLVNSSDEEINNFVSATALPTSVNWVTAGAVTPVENQG